MDLLGQSSRKLTPSELFEQEMSQLTSGAANQPKAKASSALMPPAEARKRDLIQQIGQKAKAKKAAPKKSAPPVVVNNIISPPAAPKEPGEMRLDLVHQRQNDPRLTMHGVEDSHEETSENSLTNTVGTKQTNATGTEDVDYSQQLRHVLPEDKAVREAIEANTDTSDMEAGIAMQQMEADQQRLAPAQLNLRGLAQFADVINQGKTNWAKTYEAPMSSADRAILISKLQDAINTQRKGVSETKLERLRALLKDQELTKHTYTQKMDAGTEQDTGTKVQSGTAVKAGTTLKDQTAPPVKPVSARSTGMADQKMYSAIERLGKNRAQDGPLLLQSTDVIDKELAPYGGLAGVAQTNGKNVTALEGIGGANAFLPPVLRGESKSRVYNAALALAQARRYMLTGKAANIQETREGLALLGITPMSHPSTFAEALVKYIKETKQMLAAEEAPFRAHPGVFEGYSAQPGAILSSHLDRYLTPKERKEAAPPAGKAKMSDEKKARMKFLQEKLRK